MRKKRVSKSEFKARAHELLRLIQESGESIIITDHGNPAIEICPYRAKHGDAFELLRGSVLRYAEPIDSVDVKWAAAE